MLKCDKCEAVLTMLKVHKNRAFCENCKAWIAWAIMADEGPQALQPAAASYS